MLPAGQLSVLALGGVDRGVGLGPAPTRLAAQCAGDDGGAADVCGGGLLIEERGGVVSDPDSDLNGHTASMPCWYASLDAEPGGRECSELRSGGAVLHLVRTPGNLGGCVRATEPSVCARRGD